MSHNNSSSYMNQDLDHTLGSQDDITKSVSENDNLDISNIDNFKIIWTNCKGENNVNSCEFVSFRRDLKTILESDFNGLLILIEFEKSGQLSENDQNSSSQILINRDVQSLKHTKPHCKTHWRNWSKSSFFKSFLLVFFLICFARVANFTLIAIAVFHPL